ncbi:putative immune-type receptor 15a precursor, partial [Clarias magur]
SAQMSVINQPNSVISAAPGDNVTLNCFRKEEGNTEAVVWYKQAVGHQPRVMVTVHKLAQNPVFEDEFNSPRFTVQTLKGNCSLEINNVEAADEAMYYCGLKKIVILFAKGAFLSVK